MGHDTDIREQAGSKSQLDPPIKSKKLLSTFQIFVIFFGLVLFGGLCYQNYKLRQDVAVLNVKLDLQSKEVKKIKTDVSDIEWEINQINSTVDSIDHKIDY